MGIYQVIIIALFILLFPTPDIGAPSYGGTFSYTLIPTEPPNFHGVQLMLNYDPDRFKWRKFNVYFDAGFSHFWDNSATTNKTINIFSLSPVIRYTFKKRGVITPFLELSIGLAYMDRTKFERRNLGIHFTFQDRIGIGAILGAAQRYTFGLHALHYSNAHLSSHNSGITAPVVLDLGYRFG